MKKVSLLKLLTAILIIAVVFAAMPIQSLAADSIGGADNNNASIPVAQASTYTLQDFIAGNGDFDMNFSKQIETMATKSQKVANGTYYLNGKLSGDYLRYSSSSITAESGLMSAFGNSIKWTIRCLDVARNIYSIFSASATSVHLGVSSNLNSTNIEPVVVSSSSTTPDRCRWTISYANQGGCIIKNVYSGRYLYSFGGNAYTSDTLPDSDYLYGSRVWRVAEQDYISGRELGSGFSVGTLTLVGSTPKAPTINKSPANAVWATAADFVYTGYVNNYVIYDAASGKFTLKYGSYYVATITCTHKVTNRTATFSMVLNPRVVLMGVDAGTHDHSSVFSLVQNYFTDHGYSSVLKKTGSFNCTQVDGFLNANGNNIFLSRSHGGYLGSMASPLSTYINISEAGERYLSTGSIRTLDLSNLTLAVFVGCYTGVGGENKNNLPSVAVASGAQAAIGFTEEVYCGRANEWTEAFIQLLFQGKSVQEACDALKANYTGAGLDSFVICGYKYTTIG